MKATAIAPANIAFIKYWGKRDEKLRIPANTSISMNLSAAFTSTTVEFSKNLSRHHIELVDEMFSDKEISRIVLHLDRIRDRAGIAQFAKVITKNTFPKGTGIASSASGFAALTVAASAAAGLSLSEKELTILARLGSGSACRSIPNGFVEWTTGEESDDSYACSLYPPEYWDLRDILCIVETKTKEVSSATGMEFAQTSPLWETRQNEIPERIAQLKQALREKNFQLFGEIIEEDCLSMYKVMNTQVSPLFYWTKTTEDCIKEVQANRASGTLAYFTIDAGPNVHIICEGNSEKKVVDRVKRILGVQSVLINKPSVGAHLIKEHLF